MVIKTMVSFYFDCFCYEKRQHRLNNSGKKTATFFSHFSFISSSFFFVPFRETFRLLIDSGFLFRSSILTKIHDRHQNKQNQRSFVQFEKIFCSRNHKALIRKRQCWLFENCNNDKILFDLIK